jgi:hypothetical protein
MRHRSIGKVYSSGAPMTTLRSTPSFRLAGALWIFFGVLHLLFGSSILLSLQIPRSNPTAQRYVVFTWVLAGALALGGAFSIATGVSVFLHRPWAKAVIVFVSGVLVVLFAIVLISCATTWDDSVTRQSSTRFFHQYLPPIAGTYFILGLWWFIKFTRRSEIEQFGTSDQQQRSWSSRWQNALPLGLLAGFFLVDGILCFQICLTQLRVPPMFFGFALIGPTAKVYLLLCGVSHIALGVAIFRRARWSVKTALAITLLFGSSSLVTLMDPHAPTRMRQALASMAARGIPPPLGDPVARHRFAEKTSLGVESVTLLILLFCGKKSLVASGNEQPPHERSADRLPASLGIETPRSAA